MGQDWRPYQNLTFVTPPFPEAVSGHSGFSMAAALTIAAYTGSDSYYDGETYSNYDVDDVPGTDLVGQFVGTELAFEDYQGPPIVLRWDTLIDAALDAGLSRIFGGIHIRHSNEYGQMLGERVAAEAEIRWRALFTRGGDDDLTASGAGGLLIAGAGDDIVRGRSGRDEIEGGHGDDVLRGNLNADTIHGGAGDDLVGGGRGRDQLQGGEGDDLVRGGRWRDVVDGGEGRDLVKGGFGADRVFGGVGDDVLRGGRGDDIVWGGDGSDLMSGGAGRRHVRLRRRRDRDRRDRRLPAALDGLALIGFAPEAEVSFVARAGGADLLVEGTAIACLRGVSLDDLDPRDVARADEFIDL